MSIEDSKFNDWWALYRRDSAMARVGLARLDDPHTEIIAYRAWLAGVASQQAEHRSTYVRLLDHEEQVLRLTEERDQYRAVLEAIADNEGESAVNRARQAIDWGSS